MDVTTSPGSTRWSPAYADHGPVRFLHDQQNALTPRFVQETLHTLWHPHPDFAALQPRTRVAEFWTGDSRNHPSIQLADLAASAGRIVTEHLLGHRQTEFADMLKPVVRPLIHWWVATDLPH